MQNRKRIFRNYILPLLIIIPLIGIMVGCIYIPTWDHTLLVGTKKDFRKWAKDHKGSTPPALAMLPRTSIEAMFGKPAFTSINGKCVAYVMGSEHGIWIMPLCFGGGFGEGKTHVLKLVYDDAGRLRKAISLEEYRSPPMYVFGSVLIGSESSSDPIPRAAYLLAEANQHCPDDEVIPVPADRYFEKTTSSMTTQP